MRHRLCVQSYALALALCCLAGPDALARQAAPKPASPSKRSVANLQRFLSEHAKNTDWHFVSGTPAQVAAMKKMIKQAVPLQHFAPYRLIRLVAWHPAAGYPGMVTADLRILYHPDKGEFAISSLEWIAGYRATASLDVDKLGEAQRVAYLAELVSMIPRLDNFGFEVGQVEKLERGRYLMRYKVARSIRSGERQAEVTFNKDGAVLAQGRLFGTRLLP